MILGKLLMPGRPTTLDYSSAMAYCAGSRCGWGCLDMFFFRLSFLFSFSLSLGDDPIQTEMLSQRVIKNPKTTKHTLFRGHTWHCSFSTASRC